MERLGRKHQFSELNSTGWKDRSGPPWPRKGGGGDTACHTQLFRLHTLHRAARWVVSGGLTCSPTSALQSCTFKTLTACRGWGAPFSNWSTQKSSFFLLVSLKSAFLKISPLRGRVAFELICSEGMLSSNWFTQRGAIFQWSIQSGGLFSDLPKGAP